MKEGMEEGENEKNYTGTRKQEGGYRQNWARGWSNLKENPLISQLLCK